MAYTYISIYTYKGASEVVLVVKNLPANAGDIRNIGSIPRVRKIPWRRGWQPTCFLAWRIPWTEDSGRLQSIVLQRVRQD